MTLFARRRFPLAVARTQGRTVLWPFAVQEAKILSILNVSNFPERGHFKRMFGHKLVLLNQRSCELTRRDTIKGAWFRCSGIRCVAGVRVLAPPKASHPFVSFFVRSRR